MPELPDIVVYLEALEPRVVGSTLERIRVVSPSVLRTYDPPLSAIDGKQVTGLRRIGKRIVFELTEGLFVVLHLMIAGRLAWRDSGAPVPKKVGLAAFDFSEGALILREASKAKRAGIWIINGEEALTTQDRGGIDPLVADLDEFTKVLLAENRTLKRTLTSPKNFSGIGNAYSDEILHAAKLSPTKTTARLTPEEIDRLRAATQRVLVEWTELLREKSAGQFPTKVTAFHPEMAVHGRFGERCPVCGSPVQRIVYASNETNYCPGCQTGGRILADRSLSRLLKDEWPKTLEDLEEE